MVTTHGTHVHTNVGGNVTGLSSRRMARNRWKQDEAMASSHGNPASGPLAVRVLVAVCVAGQLRTFLEPDVQASFSRLHRPGYEYFVSTDVHPPTPSVYPLIAPIRAWSVSGASSTGHQEIRRKTGLPDATRRGCPPRTCNQRSLLPMAERLVQCYLSIEDVEAAGGFRYDLVFRMRPDHVVTKNLRLEHLAPAPGVVHCVC